MALLVMAGVVAALPHIARGSLPVEYALVGCLTGDQFSMNGAASPSLVGSPIETLDGKTIRVEGYLSPGDYFRAVALFVVADEFREDLHKRYFLCDPCQTVLDSPPSRAVPRREPGVPVQLPPEVIKQFDNLPRLMRNMREQ